MEAVGGVSVEIITRAVTLVERVIGIAGSFGCCRTVGVMGAKRSVGVVRARGLLIPLIPQGTGG